MRKLASIKTVSDIMPIDGKDRIVLAMIDGWSVIVKKGEFKVGDKLKYLQSRTERPMKPSGDVFALEKRFSNETGIYR